MSIFSSKIKKKKLLIVPGTFNPGGSGGAGMAEEKKLKRPIRVKHAAMKKVKLPDKKFMQVPAHLKGAELSRYLIEKGIVLPPVKPYEKARQTAAQEAAMQRVQALVKQTEIMSKVPLDKIRKQLNGWSSIRENMTAENMERVDRKVAEYKEALAEKNYRTQRFMLDDLWRKATKKNASIAQAALSEILKEAEKERQE